MKEVVCVVGTDMSKHFDILTKFKLRVDAEQFDLQNQEDRTMLCCAVSRSYSRSCVRHHGSAFPGTFRQHGEQHHCCRLTSLTLMPATGRTRR